MATNLGLPHRSKLGLTAVCAIALACAACHAASAPSASTDDKPSASEPAANPKEDALGSQLAFLGQARSLRVIDDARAATSQAAIDAATAKAPEIARWLDTAGPESRRIVLELTLADGKVTTLAQRFWWRHDGSGSAQSVLSWIVPPEAPAFLFGERLATDLTQGAPRYTVDLYLLESTAFEHVSTGAFDASGPANAGSAAPSSDKLEIREIAGSNGTLLTSSGGTSGSGAPLTEGSRTLLDRVACGSCTLVVSGGRALGVAGTWLDDNTTMVSEPHVSGTTIACVAAGVGMNMVVPGGGGVIMQAISAGASLVDEIRGQGCVDGLRALSTVQPPGTCNSASSSMGMGSVCADSTGTGPQCGIAPAPAPSGAAELVVAVVMVAIALGRRGRPRGARSVALF
jgi:hypothetical protein